MSVFFNEDGKINLIEGVKLIGDAVSSTFGPNGRNVVIKNQSGVHITKDGATVASFVNHEDPLVSIGIDIIKDIAVKTAKDVGDGPQPLYSKVLTPNGFVQMGSLSIGDKICGTNKTIQEVVEIYPKGIKKIFEVTFDGNRVVECCEDHLWNVITNYGTSKVMTTKKLVESNRISIIQSDGNNKYGYYTPSTIVQFKERDYSELLDPYLVGLLLGDGSLSGTGSIELSIGLKKEHVIEKIILPEGLSLSIKKDEERNVFRVKLKGIDNKGRTVKEIIEKIGLLGVKSNTKFIPKKYLYSDYESRLRLFKGLLDTDGYINKRGLFEFSTVSRQLADDFLELALSIGRHTLIDIHSRENDKDSYSDNSIYRLYERKGYKYGNKLVSIKETDRYTDMQCIKVSNPDNLYITDNYIVTHNTTTSTILAKGIVDYLSLEKHNTLGLTKDLNSDLKKIVEYLEKNKINIDSREDLVKVATISANNDSELGELIADTFYKVGKDGVVTFEESSEITDSVVYSNGLQLSSGYISPYFVNTTKNTCELNNVLIAIFNEKVSDSKEIIDVCEQAIKEHKNILLIAPNFDSSVIRTLLLNKGGKLESCCIISPANGIYRDILLDDLKCIIGNTLTCEKVIIDKDKISLIGCSITEEVKNNKINEIKSLITNSQLGEFDLKFHKKRIANYSDGVATIFVGGYSKVEIVEKKDRVEDAISAVRAALDGGVLPGGGTALLHASFDLDLKILKDIIKLPYILLYDSSMPQTKDLGSLKGNFWEGINFKTWKKGNMYEMGIVDPFLVTKTSLENAIFAASLILTNECVIINMGE